MMKRQSIGWTAVVLALSLGGCSDLPRDQEGWTERIRNSGVLTVGVSREGGPSRPLEEREKRLVESVARTLGARIDWREGNAHALLQELEERRLPIVAATLPSDSPFAQRVGLSQPYLRKGPEGKDYCLAVAPGENRLLLRVDRIIADEQRREKER